MNLILTGIMGADMIAKTLREFLVARLRLQIAVMQANGSNCDHLLKCLNRLAGK